MANGDVHPALAFGVLGVGARMARVLLCMGGAFVLGLNAAPAEMMIHGFPRSRGGI
jgi:hypothetical protein